MHQYRNGLFFSRWLSRSALLLLLALSSGHSVSAGGLDSPVSSISGNAATATALATTPSGCGATQFSNAIAASGNLTCAQPGNVTGNSATTTALAVNGGNCSAGSFPLGVDSAGAVESCTALPTTITGTASQVTASAATGPITLSLSNPINVATSGNAATATALAANGANCSGNNFALGVDASGVGECAQPSFSNLSGAATIAQLPTLDNARVYNSALQTIPNNVNTAVTFDTERRDTNNLHSTSSNTDRITFAVAGNYSFTCHVGWVAAATGFRHVLLELNGTTVFAVCGISADAVNTQQMSCPGTYLVAANDYVRCLVAQTSGGNLNIGATGNYSPELSAQFESN